MYDNVDRDNRHQASLETTAAALNRDETVTRRLGSHLCRTAHGCNIDSRKGHERNGRTSEDVAGSEIRHERLEHPGGR